MTRTETRLAIKALPHMSATLTDGEWRVFVTLQSVVMAFPDKSLSWALRKVEAMACYTNDAEDALDTAKAMSTHWEAMYAPKVPA